MKNKILCKILAFVMLTILFVQFALTIVVFAKDEVSIEYSNVWIDLKASSVFNAENHVQRYPSNPNDYKLEVISIAESEGGGGCRGRQWSDLFAVESKRTKLEREPS